MDAVEKRAFEIWRERERRFPQFVRRMPPDELDRATGAWAVVMQQAAEEIAQGQLF
jgi:hypothetical protein